MFKFLHYVVAPAVLLSNVPETSDHFLLECSVALKVANKEITNKNGSIYSEKRMWNENNSGSLLS